MYHGFIQRKRQTRTETFKASLYRSRRGTDASDDRRTSSLDSKVVRRIPDPEEKNTDAPEENTSETVSEASAPTTEKTDVNTQTTTGKEPAGFRRKKLSLPDFERTFFAPVDCRNRSAIYVSAQTKHKVSEILHLLGNDNTRLTALVDNMLRFVIGIYSDELNYLHEKKNNRQPF